MEKTVRIFCKNTNSYHEIPAGMLLFDIYKTLKITLKLPVVAARVNYKVEDLNFPVYKPKDIEFIDTSCPSGMRVYVRTLTMVVAKAISDVFPAATFHIQHSISKGYYCTLEKYERPVTQEVIDKIKNRVNEIIFAGEKIVCEEKQTKTVRQLFADLGQSDRENLFQTFGEPYCRYFRIGNFVDYYNGVLLPATNYLCLYDLCPAYDGILLRVPDRENPVNLADFTPQPKLYEIFQEYARWNKIMNISNIGDFNLACQRNRSFDLIKISEALHEKKVVAIADQIYTRGNVHFVLISGPSSSGKTTFSKRLSIQLKVSGLSPIAISLDNYFVSRAQTPKDENGDFDYEHINALDLRLFQQNMQDLIAGKEIDLPVFDFEKGERIYKGEKLKLGKNDILILEGIHALNPLLTENLLQNSIFKIYVSALTTISIDNHNLIPTTDVRLLRRIIRDSKYRSYSACDTISRWASVRRGEEKWVFPYQENADVMFNSALLFELAVLKRHALPLLYEVPKYSEEYTEAHRLIKFLNFFVSIDEREIPPTSLLREFVGGSSFRY